MKVRFERLVHKWTFTFQATIDNVSWAAYVKRLFIPFPRTITIVENGLVEYLMKERTLKTRMLLKLLFLPFTKYIFEKRSEYAILKNGEEKGSISLHQTLTEIRYDITYDNRLFSVFSRIVEFKIRYYLFENKQQVGVLEQDSVGKHDIYPLYGTFNQNVPEIVVMSFLLHLHVLKLQDIALSYEFYSKSYRIAGFQTVNRALDVDFNDIELENPRKKK